MTDETKLTPMQKVDELIERGKSKGGLTYKEVIDTLGNDLSLIHISEPTRRS